MDSRLKSEPGTSAEPLMEILHHCADGYKKFAALKAALEMRVFEQLTVPRTPKELTETLGTDPGLTENLCRVLVSLGLIVRENGCYKNSDLSNTYLTAGSPLYQREVIINLANGLKLWEQLPGILQSGPIVAGEEQYFANNLIHSLAREALCGELQRTVGLVTRCAEFEKASKLLDLGGGHGLYAIAFAAANPNIRAYVYDFPDVAQDTRQYIKEFRADRVEVLQGNFFQDDLGEGYDVVFFASNPGGKNRRLVPKIYSCMNEGGLFINKHCFYSPEEYSKSALLDMEWSLTRFAGVAKENRVYSFAGDLFFEEYLALLQEYFDILKIYQAPDFAGCPLSKIGDTLDSKIIIGAKKSGR